MNSQEKSLIDSVFDQLAQASGGTKDAEAMAHIQDHVAKQPNSAYGMVQAVLFQEMALNQASARIAELERQLAQTNGQSQGSGFLGGAGPWGRASAPNAAPAAPIQQPQPQTSSGPWGPSMQPAGGGFLHNMMGMAAGVAAGSLLADGIASLFGGHHMFGGYGGGYGGGFGGIGGGMGPWGGSPGMVENVTVNNYGVTDGSGAASQDGLPSDGSGYQDASFDPSLDDGGSFDDGGGFDSSDI